MSRELPLDPVSIDVSSLVERSVASLYSHLVTRPTGRAVRMAIEAQLAETGGRALSLVDFSEVRVLDFSCADEVVAKLLLRFRERSEAPPAFFVFRGVSDVHRDPIEAVLRRQTLAAVAQTGEGGFELLGSVSPDEKRVWSTVEELGRMTADGLDGVFARARDRKLLDTLADRRLVFRIPGGGEYRALSALVRDLEG